MPLAKDGADHEIMTEEELMMSTVRFSGILGTAFDAIHSVHYQFKCIVTCMLLTLMCLPSSSVFTKTGFENGP